jgi:hypothetical protein
MAEINADSKHTVNSPVELAWGARAIGAVINRTERQVSHLLIRGHIKSARKLGGVYVANVGALMREFGGQS